MKILDVIVGILLVIGGLNWGLIGFFDFDLISTFFGDMSALTRLVFCLIGVSALYYVFQWNSFYRKRSKR